MKLIHLSDLHIGKRYKEVSFLEDQRHILNEILWIIAEENPDCVAIAGDVYDKAVPSAEAVELMDDFLVSLSALNTQVFIISGNHDSPERLAFGGRLIEASGIHLSPVYHGSVLPITVKDGFGEVNVFMLPFVKPANVRRFYPEEKIESYTDALNVCIGKMQVDERQRNVLITHQFVTGAERSESEEISVGGSDNVDAGVFGAFDYVALGHIHGPQNITERVRYSGTPLKYSFSEAKQEKSVTVVELKEKGNLSVRTVPLKPLRDMVELKGTYGELTLKKNYENTSYREDYVHITLTDEEDIPNALGNLRAVYHNILKLDYDNSRTRHAAQIDGAEDVERKSPLALFSEFYELQNGSPMSDRQTEFMRKLIEQIWEEET